MGGVCSGQTRPVQQQPPPPPPEEEFVRLQGRVTLEAELQQLDENFSETFQTAVALALQMEPARVTVVGITEGSAVVEFRLRMSSSEAARTPDRQGAIGAIPSIGGFPVLSAEVAEVAEVAGDNAPAASPEGADLLPAMVAAGAAVAVVALLALYKACCKKKLPQEYAQWN